MFYVYRFICLRAARLCYVHWETHARFVLEVYVTADNLACCCEVMYLGVSKLEKCCNSAGPLPLVFNVCVADYLSSPNSSHVCHISKSRLNAPSWAS